jgi:hypothetical protein
LHTRAAKSGNDEPGDDTGEDARLGLDTGSDSEGHRKWKSDNANGEPGHQIREDCSVV